MSIATHSSENTKHRLSKVDEAARSVHVDIWHRRHELWDGNLPSDLIGFLDPGVALVAKGYKVQSVGSIGELVVNGVRNEVAGMIDRDRKVVSISQRFLQPVQRFTLAHELGHAVCHPNGGGMHRDVPVEKSGVSRDWKEVEADHFASYFLMPNKLMHDQVNKCFGTSCIQLSEEVAYALCGTSADRIRQRCKSLRDLSMLVAGAGSFDRQQFRSLASQFRVSQTAMAIRLEQLRLVAF